MVNGIYSKKFQIRLLDIKLLCFLIIFYTFAILYVTKSAF